MIVFRILKARSHGEMSEKNRLTGFFLSPETAKEETELNVRTKNGERKRSVVQNFVQKDWTARCLT